MSVRSNVIVIAAGLVVSALVLPVIENLLDEETDRGLFSAYASG